MLSLALQLLFWVIVLILAAGAVFKKAGRK